MPALPLVLARPPLALSTARVFAALGGEVRPPLPALPPFSNIGAVAEWLAGTRNDLSGPAGAIAPAAEAGVSALMHDHDCMIARMTGSGPTAFGLFPSAAAAERTASRLAAAEPSWWVRATMTGAA
jgi:4-diphosphocytidyl-2-C-methyl-D-erythritol kinase